MITFVLLNVIYLQQLSTSFNPMLAKPQEREKAIALRKRGLSYSEIIQHLPVAQATLSLWLRHIPLTDEQKARLKDISQGAGARARRNMRLIKEKILETEVECEISSLINQPFFLLGLALYWAEGSKQKPWNLSEKVNFCNTDVRTILIMKKWFNKYLHTSEDRYRYRLAIHETADIKTAKEIWADLLSVPCDDIKVSLKHNHIKLRHKTNDYKGLVSVSLSRSTWLNRRIELWTKAATRQILE